MKIENSVFLVTGAGSGLGAGTARMLVAQGGKVLLVDRNPELGEALAHELGASAAFAQADVANEEEAAKAVSVALSHFGKLDALINSVVVVPAEKMIGRDGPHRLESFSRTVRVNLVGTFNMLRLVAAELVHNTPDADGERGVIINTASVAAFEGQIGQAAFSAFQGTYGSVKTACDSLERRSRNIRLQKPTSRSAEKGIRHRTQRNRLWDNITIDIFSFLCYDRTNSTIPAKRPEWMQTGRGGNSGEAHPA